MKKIKKEKIPCNTPKKINIIAQKVMRIDHPAKNKMPKQYVKAFNKVYDDNDKSAVLIRRGKDVLLKKKLVAKPLISQRIRFINPIKLIRLFNSYLPLESNIFFEQDPETLTPFLAYESVISDYSVAQIEKHKNKDKYLLKTRLRIVVSNEMLKYVISQFWYYNEWLQSQGNYKAKKLSELLLSILDNKNAKSALKPILVESLINEKRYFVKISSKRRKIIKSQAYVTRIEEHDYQKYSMPIIIRFDVSQNYLDLVKVNLNFAESHGGFPFVRTTYMLNWLDTYNTVFNIHLNDPDINTTVTIDEPDQVLTNNMIYLQDCNQQKLDYDLEIYFEKYVKNDINYTKEYYVWVKKSKKLDLSDNKKQTK